MKVCPSCQATHIKNGTFCSRSCANSRGPRTDEWKAHVGALQKTRRTGFLRNSTTEEQYNADPKICVMCSSPIAWAGCVPARSTCSDVCFTRLRRENGLRINKGSGGLRQGAGRGKKGWYRGIWCDSTYELVYVIYCLDHNKQIARCTESFPYDLNGKTHHYHPDFVVDGSLVEIKGFVTATTQLKLNAVPKQIELLTKKELNEAFNHVCEKTGLPEKQLSQLYDSSRPNR